MAGVRSWFCFSVACVLLCAVTSANAGAGVPSAAALAATKENSQRLAARRGANQGEPTVAGFSSRKLAHLILIDESSVRAITSGEADEAAAAPDTKPAPAGDAEADVFWNPTFLKKAAHTGIWHPPVRKTAGKFRDADSSFDDR